MACSSLNMSVFESESRFDSIAVLSLKKLYFRVPGFRVLESRMKGTDANTNSGPDSQKIRKN